VISAPYRDTAVVIRVAILQPIRNGSALEITHWDEHREMPRTKARGYEFLCDNLEIQETTAAGFAWRQWKDGKKEIFIIPDVKTEREKAASIPGYKHTFSYIHEGQTEIKSILCRVLSFRTARSHGDSGENLCAILCLDANQADILNSEVWESTISPRIGSLLNLIVIAAHLDRSVSSVLAKISSKGKQETTTAIADSSTGDGGNAPSTTH
jgi:hypothetical protein